jgi:hypothetical protein
MLIVHSTADVSLDDLRQLVAEIAQEISSELDESQIFLRSGDPPSWVSLLAGADWWIKVLAGYAVLYVTEIVKEAGKETWRNRAKVVVLASAGANLVGKLATSLHRLRGRLLCKTSIGIGLPVPDTYFATRLRLEGADVDEMTLEVALFVHHLPALQALLAEAGLDSGRYSGAVVLRLLPDGGLSVC